MLAGKLDYGRHPNNVSIAFLHLQDIQGLRMVVVIDFDDHHGN